MQYLRHLSYTEFQYYRVPIDRYSGSDLEVALFQVTRGGRGEDYLELRELYLAHRQEHLEELLDITINLYGYMDEWGAYDDYVRYVAFPFAVEYYPRSGYEQFEGNLSLDDEVRDKLTESYLQNKEFEAIIKVQVPILFSAAKFEIETHQFLAKLENAYQELQPSSIPEFALTSYPSGNGEESGLNYNSKVFRKPDDQRLAIKVFQNFDDKCRDNTISGLYYLLLDGKHLVADNRSLFVSWLQVINPDLAPKRIQGRNQVGNQPILKTIYRIAMCE